jgi:hypothetical protein
MEKIFNLFILPTCRKSSTLCRITTYLKTIILFVCLALPSTLVHSQVKNKLLLQVDTLKAVLSGADTLNPFDETIDSINDKISTVNEEIFLNLSGILTNPEILSVNIDSLLEHSFLEKVHSNDKRLWIFSWYENTGGSWKSNLNLIHYKTKLNKPKVDESDQGVFCSNGAGFNKIYKLNSKSRNLYLCMGSGISCNTCIYKIATVVELTKDSINFNYPAFTFQKKDDNLPGSASQSCFTLEARLGNIEKFEFNPATQILTYVFFTDDNTPVQSVKQKRIVRKLQFDGQKFR